MSLHASFLVTLPNHNVRYLSVLQRPSKNHPFKAESSDSGFLHEGRLSLPVTSKSALKSSPKRLTFCIPFPGRDPVQPPQKLSRISEKAPTVTTCDKRVSNDTVIRTSTALHDAIHPQVEPTVRSKSAASSGTCDAPGHNTEETFLVQTPTKALSESDHLSFHLSSPPTVLGNLVTGNNTPRHLGFSQKPASIRNPNRLNQLPTGTIHGRSVSDTTVLFDPMTSLM
ncbi:unnamed protein product [Dicrocoelium dendriticum]|nr:unnamed protein product [Dicrocoelium dendriticum]